MPTPREEAISDAEPDRPGVVAYLRRGADWLRGLHRGYAYTGHLPRRRD